MFGETVRDKAKVAMANEAATRAFNVSRVLSKHSARQKVRARLLHFLNFFVGIAVALSTLLALAPPFAQMMGSRLPILMGLVAAFLLVLDAGLSSFLDEPNPERFQDYYVYIHGKGRKLADLARDVDIEDQEWRVRIRVLKELVDDEVADALGKWPWIENEIRRTGLDPCFGQIAIPGVVGIDSIVGDSQEPEPQ